MHRERHRARIDEGLGELDELVHHLEQACGRLWTFWTCEKDPTIPPWAVDLEFVMP